MLTVLSCTPSMEATAPVPPSASIRSPVELSMTPYNSHRANYVKSQIANGLGKVGVHRQQMSRRADEPSSDPQAARLFFTRKALGFDTQEDFAADLNIGKSTLNPWETGKREMPKDRTDQLHAKYGIPPEWIYEGVIDRLPPAILGRLLELDADYLMAAHSPALARIIRKPRN